jgi:hypothetical protein
VVKYSTDFSLTANELNRIANVDFAKFDSIELDKRIMLNKPDNMYEGAINLISKPFRLDVDVKVDMKAQFL